MLTYSIPKAFVLTPIELKTDAGFVILIDQHHICGFRRDLILYSQPIDMNQHSVMNVKSSVNKFDAGNKAYADPININQLLVLFIMLLGQIINSSYFPLRKILLLKI